MNLPEATQIPVLVKNVPNVLGHAKNSSTQKILKFLKGC